MQSVVLTCALEKDVSECRHCGTKMHVVVYKGQQRVICEKLVGLLKEVVGEQQIQSRPAEVVREGADGVGSPSALLQAFLGNVESDGVSTALQTMGILGGPTAMAVIVTLAAPEVLPTHDDTDLTQHLLQHFAPAVAKL